MNSAIVGPRDQWRQYTWGNAERSSLFTDASNPITAPALTSFIKESIEIKNSKGKRLSIERDAKFVQVCAVESRRGGPSSCFTCSNAHCAFSIRSRLGSTTHFY